MLISRSVYVHAQVQWESTDVNPRAPSAQHILHFIPVYTFRSRLIILVVLCDLEYSERCENAIG